MEFKWFPYIKSYFDLKLYTTDDVKIFVVVNWITKEEYQTITGVEYMALVE